MNFELQPQEGGPTDPRKEEGVSRLRLVESAFNPQDPTASQLEKIAEIEAAAAMKAEQAAFDERVFGGKVDSTPPASVPTAKPKEIVTPALSFEGAQPEEEIYDTIQKL